eukprot:7081739-Karenia_brevis.AAC.1
MNDVASLGELVTLSQSISQVRQNNNSGQKPSQSPGQDVEPSWLTKFETVAGKFTDAIKKKDDTAINQDQEGSNGARGSEEPQTKSDAANFEEMLSRSTLWKKMSKDVGNLK